MHYFIGFIFGLIPALIILGSISSNHPPFARWVSRGFKGLLELWGLELCVVDDINKMSSQIAQLRRQLTKANAQNSAKPPIDMTRKSRDRM